MNEALPPIARYKIGYHADEWGQRSSTPGGIPDHAGSWVRYEDHAAVITALRTQQPAPATQQAGEVRKIDRGFRWDGENLQHVPTLLLEFEPVPVNSPYDAKGWQDRDAVANRLSSPTAQAAESVPEAAHSMAVAMLNEMHQRMGADVVRKCNFDSLAFERIAQRHMEAALVGRKDLQMAGSHPAPCGKFCEAQAFRIENRNLKSQLAAARAPADSVPEDAARLEFLIETRAYVVSDPDACPGYWLHYVASDGATWVQMSDHPTPRAAIDAAIDAARKQGGAT